MYVVFISPLSFRFHVRCEELCSAECRVQSECRAGKECKYIYIAWVLSMRQHGYIAENILCTHSKYPNGKIEMRALTVACLRISTTAFCGGPQ